MKIKIKSVSNRLFWRRVKCSGKCLLYLCFCFFRSLVDVKCRSLPENRSTMDSVFANDLLVELILSFLPGKELTNCMQVCRAWKEKISKIRESRVCCPLILIAFPGHQQKGLACFDDDWPHWSLWLELQRKGLSRQFVSFI